MLSKTVQKGPKDAISGLPRGVPQDPPKTRILRAARFAVKAVQTSKTVAVEDIILHCKHGERYITCQAIEIKVAQNLGYFAV